MALKDLVLKTNLINELKNELFNEWLNSDPTHWPTIRAKIGLLSTAEVILNRMATPDE